MILARAPHLCRESIPRTVERRRDHYERVRARVDVRERRSASRKVHGMLYDVPWRRRAQGCERSGNHDQDEENYSVRRLVPYRLIKAA